MFTSRCGILHVSAVPRQKFGTPKLVKFSQTDILQNESCHPLSCILLFLLIWGQKFVHCFFAKHEKFSSIFHISKRLENNWAKATSSSGLLICRSSFLAITVDVILPYIANVIGELGIWANGNQTEYLKGYWVVLCSEVVAPVFKYVGRIFGLRLGHQFYVNFLFIVVSSLIGIPDSLSCMLDSRDQVSGFYRKKFLEFCGISVLVTCLIVPVSKILATVILTVKIVCLIVLHIVGVESLERNAGRNVCGGEI